MAKVIGVDTQIRGKLGARIYQVLNGEQIIKTMANPTNPRSTNQTTYRTRFSALVQGFKKIAASIIRPLWKTTLSGNQTPWGNFIGASLDNQSSSTLDPEEVVLGQGSLEPIAGLAGEYDSTTGELDATWDGHAYGNGLAADNVSFVVFDKHSETIVAEDQDAESRDTENYTIGCPASLTATDLVLFAVCHRGSIVSDDVSMVADSSAAACTAPA